jgi:hypothetical protein
LKTYCIQWEYVSLESILWRVYWRVSSSFGYYPPFQEVPRSGIRWLWYSP